MAGPTLAPSSTSYQLSTLAWALATELAGGESDRLSGLDPETLEGLHQELRAAGITAGSFSGSTSLVPEWLQLIRQAAAAPLRLRCVARTDTISVHSRVALSEGNGLAITFSRDIAESGGSVHVTAIHSTTRITVFPERDLWQVVSGNFPLALPDESAARSFAEESDVVLAASRPRATFHFAVEARTPESPDRYSTHRAWSLSECLYAVKTASSGAREGVLTPVQPSRMAEQLVWDVLGAHDFLAAGTSGRANTAGTTGQGGQL